MQTTTFELNIVPRGVAPVLPVKQGDTGARTLKAIIYDDTGTMDLSDVYDAAISIKRANGSSVILKMRDDGVCTIDTANSTVTFDLTAAMTAVAGSAKAEIIFYTEDAERIATATFVLYVERSTNTGEDVVTDSSFEGSIETALKNYLLSTGLVDPSRLEKIVRCKLITHTSNNDLIGDVNADGVIDDADVLIAARIASGAYTPTDRELEAAAVLGRKAHNRFVVTAEDAEELSTLITRMSTGEIIARIRVEYADESVGLIPVVWPKPEGPTDSQTETAVAKWLDSHPEATTTVSDGSLNIAKFTSEAQKQMVKDYITPQMFGAKADGVTNDANALAAASEYCVSTNRPLYLPIGQYLISTPITLTGVKVIRADGSLIVPNGITCRDYSGQNNSIDWFFREIDGTLTVAGLKSAKVEVGKASGVTLLADSTADRIGSISYSVFTLRYCNNLELIGIGEGWITSNVFQCSRVWNIKIAGDEYSHNHNKFYDATIEGQEKTPASIVIDRAKENYFYNIRAEGSRSYTFGPLARYNFVEVGWSSANNLLINPLITANGNIHKNFLYFAGHSPFIKKELSIHNGSRNYDASRAYPTKTGFHVLANSSRFLATNFIPITDVTAIEIVSDSQFFRGYIYGYDENGEQVTIDSTNDVSLYLLNLSLSNGRYDVSSNQYRQRAILCRYKSVEGEITDTNIHYVRVFVSASSAASPKFLRVTVTSKNNGEGERASIADLNRNYLYASDTPLTNEAAQWKKGDFAINTGEGSNVGWIYNGTEWKAVEAAV